MLALFFEVRPREDGGWDRYLSIAARLRPLLAEQEGLLFIDRYRSLLHPGTLLSHSLWRDEAALAAWRANGVHSGAQSKGRQDVFDDYRLRVAHVVRTATPGGPTEPAAPRSTYRDPAARSARFTIVATAAAEIRLDDAEPSDIFESINREGERLWLFDADSEATASNLIDTLCGAGATARACEVERDYGMFDRAEAPQYYPPVARCGAKGNQDVSGDRVNPSRGVIRNPATLTSRERRVEGSIGRISARQGWAETGDEDAGRGGGDAAAARSGLGHAADRGRGGV